MVQRFQKNIRYSGLNYQWKNWLPGVLVSWIRTKKLLKVWFSSFMGHSACIGPQNERGGSLNRNPP